MNIYLYILLIGNNMFNFVNSITETQLLKCSFTLIVNFKD